MVTNDSLAIIWFLCGLNVRIVERMWAGGFFIIIEVQRRIKKGNLLGKKKKFEKRAFLSKAPSDVEFSVTSVTESRRFEPARFIYSSVMPEFG